MFLGASLGSIHRTTGSKQRRSRMEVEDMKASDNQRKLHGTRARRFSQASKVRGLEVDIKRDTAKSAKPSPVVSIQKTTGSSECPGESKAERLCHNGYVITALLTLVQNTEKSLLEGCAVLHVTIVTA